MFHAIDKTDNYDFIYHQHVIKPALIGMLGAWISGGVEWNIPHHHRASTLMTVDHTMTENPDGSKTIWMREIELRHRMKWIVGLTLYPPICFFAWNYQDDFLAGYDHGKEAGVALVADHHIVPGKKFFEWGNGTTGETWNKILTDTDGPYLELMVGGYSDNQPDYSWCQPYEVKTLKQYWYPLRGLGGVKKANRDAALNLEATRANTVRLAFNTTSMQKNATARLNAKGKVLFERDIDISPANPFSKEAALPLGVKEQDPYYEEALRRDAGDYRVNTELAILYLKRGTYKKAEEKLRRAVERATRNYTSPRDGEALYYLGVALRAQGDLDAATDAFYKATWSLAWHSAAYYSLAELECQKENFEKALELLDRSLSTNTFDTKAQDLKAVTLRKLGRLDEAEQVASSVIAFDPLDFWAGNELHLTKIGEGKKDEAMKVLDHLKTKMRGAVQSYLELAADYGDCGFWDEAIHVLSRLIEPNVKPAVTFPMV
jgi:tetratricopeptide (TPR) repeat protein